MGRGTTRRVVEGLSDSASPSTAFHAVPLPIAFGDREEMKFPKNGAAPALVSPGPQSPSDGQEGDAHRRAAAAHTSRPRGRPTARETQAMRPHIWTGWARLK